MSLFHTGNTRRTLLAVSISMVVAPRVYAQSAPAKLDEIVVTTKRADDTQERRYATAAKMVFGREELDRHGDASLGEVLKRLPGVTVAGTPGRGGDIRMRGLGNGYTQILINGEPAPRGFSMDALAPEQVERIEIMRAPVAEFGARAIAGTINIVLRGVAAKRENQVRPGIGWEQGHAQPSLRVERSNGDGNFSYNVHASGSHRNLGTESLTTTTTRDPATLTPTTLQREQIGSRTVGDNVHANAKFDWKFGDGENLSVQPFVMQARSTTDGQSRLDQPLGATPPNYANAAWRTDSDSSMLRVMSNLRLNLADDAKLDLRLTGGVADSDSRTPRTEYDAAGAVAHTSLASSGIRDTTFSTAGKVSRPVGDGHNLAFGLELEQSQRKESATTVQDGVLQLAQYGSSVQARTRRVAGFGQDEWDISPLWSVYGGLRWETVGTRSEWTGNSVRTDSNVLSPLLHSVWRFTEESRDQVRLGLTRSYKSPTLAQLVPRPTLATAYPAAGANTPTSPDTAGNPSLRPELAWGVDLSFEHYLADGGLLSASLFQRNIENLIRSVTSLQAVSWSPAQRWVTTPQNVGNATTRGLELEAKFRLAEIVADAPPLELRANFSRFWSRVDSVPGPDNRLDQQPAKTANLGLDYKFRSLPLSLGGNLNWTPGYTVQQSATQSYAQGAKRGYDVYALWRFDPKVQLRLSASNVLHQDYRTATGVASATTNQTADVAARTYASWSARLEMRF